MARPTLDPAGVPMTFIGLRLPADMLNALDELAATQGIDRSNLIRQLLSQHTANA